MNKNYEHARFVGNIMLLRGFAKFRKATIGFIMSVCPSYPSVLVEQLGSHGTDIGNFTFDYFSKICEENLSYAKI